MYSWIGRQIQPLQKRSRFHFEYLGVLDPSRCFADPIQKSNAILRVSQVLLGAEIVPYVSKMYSTKEPPKHVWISIRILLLKLQIELY
jgi:hypothetical protein